jgi:glycogen phosphorylase
MAVPHLSTVDSGLTWTPQCSGGDHYRHLADLTSYARAHADLDACYADRESWSRKAIINVASSGKFSSDRTIKEYADDIWNLKPSPVT